MTSFLPAETTATARIGEDETVLVGFLLAVGAAFAYSGASLLQSVGARRAALRTESLSGLAGQPLYIAGLALDGIGFAAYVVALQFLPLFVVQTTVASNVALTAILAAVLLGTHLRRAAWWAVAAVIVGLVLIALSAEARENVDLPNAWRWVLLATTIPIAAFGVWAYRGGRDGMLALSAGLAFSVVAIAARALEFPDPLWRILLDPLLWTVAVQGAAGTLLFARAVQSSNVTRITTITFTTETVLPSMVGLLFLNDAVRPGWAASAIAGFVLAVGGAILLSRWTSSVPEGGRGTADRSRSPELHQDHVPASDALSPSEPLVASPPRDQRTVRGADPIGDKPDERA
jgi:drug/metabolite transporter (DMT)-like permease